MILLVSTALAATVQVVAPSGRVLAEQPITDAAEAVFMWRGAPWKIDVVAREGGWDSALTRWEHGREAGGSMLSTSRRSDGCASMSAGRSRDALTVVISEGPVVESVPTCFDAPVPWARPIARLSQHGPYSREAATPDVHVGGPVGARHHFTMLVEGSKMDWRVEDADGVEWVAQVGVTSIGDEGLETVVAWRRADPVLLWRPTRTVAATLPYGEEITLSGPVALAVRAEAPR